jgi:putative membrane protein
MHHIGCVFVMKKENNYKDTLLVMLKGFIIGSSMSVPGVSGGTMAILLGIYDKLISSVSRFLKDIKGNIIFLMKVCIGAGIGIFTLSNVIKKLLEFAPIPVSLFFLGAVIGGVPALYKKTKTNDSKSTVSSIIYFIVGLAAVISIGFIPTGTISVASGSGVGHYLMLFVTGVIIALALVLPGISTSHMLLVLGMYDSMLDAISSFDIIYVGTLGVATLIGIFLITRPIEWTMNKFPRQTYCVVIGFVIGSTWEIFYDKIYPAIPANANIGWWVATVIISLITFALGFKAIMALSKFSND